MKPLGPKSIRARSTTIAVAVTAVAMAVILVATSFVMTGLLRDATLGVLQSDLREAVEEASEGDYKEAVENVDSSLVQVVAQDGTVLACSPRIRHLSSLADAVGDKETFKIDSLESYGSEPSPWLAEGSPYLMAEAQATCEDETVTIVALSSIRSGQETIQGTLRLLVAVFAFALVLVGIFTWLLTKRTLAPVEQMRSEVANIQAHDLTARIDVPAGDPDLARLAATFNELLSRLERSANEQKQFVSDASHELKSPIAATALMIETLKAHPESVDLDTALRDMSAENARMQALVEDMLVLARYDEGRMKLAKAPIDLMDLIASEVRAASAIAPEAHVDTSGITPLVCTGDPELLSHALRNLLENALHYAKTRVEVSCEQDDETIRIHVQDDGPGIPKARREDVFGRFVRLDSSRSREHGSTGLGLAVVRSIMERHCGRAYFDEPSTLDGAHAVIELPAD